MGTSRRRGRKRDKKVTEKERNEIDKDITLEDIEETIKKKP